MAHETFLCSSSATQKKYQFLYIPAHPARGNLVSCRSREWKQNEQGFLLQIISPSLLWTQVRFSSVFCIAHVKYVHTQNWYGISTELTSGCLWHISAVSPLAHLSSLPSAVECPA